MEPAPNLDREQCLDEILFAYLQAVEAGAAPTQAELLARHPDFAGELGAFFAAQAEFDALAAPLRGMRDSTPTGFDGTLDDSPRPSVRPAPWSVPVPPNGDYELLEELGRGGMGVVYKARQVRLNRVVALKVLRSNPHASPESLARFQREAEAIARLQHPHIIQVFDCGAWQDQPYLVMEFVAGGSLARQLQGRPRPPWEAAPLMEMLARAVSAVHQAGIVHRDLKPSNVLLTADGTPKVADFGLAKLLSTADQPASGPATEAGAILGTAAYMAPEQAAGRSAEVGPAVDVYSLGAILYELLTGRPPFQGDGPVDTLRQVLWHEPVPPRRLQPEVPGELEAICLKCLQKKPQHRYPSAQLLADALQAWTADQTSADQPGPVAARASVPRQRRWLRGAAAVALLVGFLATGTAAVLLFPFEQGAFVIDTDDPNFSFQVSKEGGVTLHDRKTNRNYLLKVLRQEKGAFDLEVTDQGADLVFQAKTFSIKRGEKVALKAWLERKPGPAPGQPAALSEAWLRHVSALNAEQQATAVTNKLKELNPEFDGEVTYRFEKGTITSALLTPTNLSDLSPLRVLTDLHEVSCRGSKDRPGKLSDLSPLKDLTLAVLQCDYTNVSDLSPLQAMPLTLLRCDHTHVRDLSPLKNLKLTHLSCGDSRVSDLSPLQGMGLTSLSCDGTRVADLSPLKGMRLTVLYCSDTKVSDLLPLQGMPLSALNCGSTRVIDLSPLKGMPLIEFHCFDTEVSDLSPLRDMKLTYLRCEHAKVTDLSVLRGMPLKELYCDFQPERDTAILRSITTLETINYKSAREFWKEVDAKKP